MVISVKKCAENIIDNKNSLLLEDENKNDVLNNDLFR
jgi:hypothetical protein